MAIEVKADSWESDNTDAVTVDENGLLTVLQPNVMTVIHATHGGLTDNLTVQTVFRPESVSLSHRDETIQVGVTAGDVVSFYALPSDCYFTGLEYTTSTPDLVDVTDPTRGTFTGKVAGMAKIGCTVHLIGDETMLAAEVDVEVVAAEAGTPATGE